MQKVTVLPYELVSGNLNFGLLEHPDLGYQIPSGSVDPDEKVEHAALRELKEETGLDSVELTQLDTRKYNLSYMQSTYKSDVVTLRRGLPVQITSNRDRVVRVKYTEHEMVGGEQHERLIVNVDIDDSHVTTGVERFFYLSAVKSLPAVSLDIFADGINFKLTRVKSLSALSLVKAQDDWLKICMEGIDGIT